MKIVWETSLEANRQYLARYVSQSRERNAAAGISRGDELTELNLRIRPLREQWEARGPGLLTALTRHLPWLTQPEDVRLTLVQPIHGGGGLIISETALQFEAVLANPLPHVPEVLRLGWLLAQMAANASVEALVAIARVEPTASRELVAEALIPPMLLAGEHVELSSYNRDTLREALAAWRLKVPTAAERADRLYDWWNAIGPRELDAAHWWQAVLELR
jgi:hypothetical protein